MAKLDASGRMDLSKRLEKARMDQLMRDENARKRDEKARMDQLMRDENARKRDENARIEDQGM